MMYYNIGLEHPFFSALVVHTLRHNKFKGGHNSNQMQLLGNWIHPHACGGLREFFKKMTKWVRFGLSKYMLTIVGD